MPDLDCVGQDKRCQSQGLNHGEDLRCEEHFEAAGAVGEDAGDWCEEEIRCVEDESNQPEHEDRIGKSVDQPVKRD